MFLFSAHLFSGQLTQSQIPHLKLNMPTKIYLLRHAQGLHNARPADCDLNALRTDPLFRDAVLTEVGYSQTIQLRQEFAGLKFDVIYCSPMRRCRQTLLGIKPETIDIGVILDDRLIEQPTGINICNHRLDRNEVIASCPAAWNVSEVHDINPFHNMSDVADVQNIQSIVRHICTSHAGMVVLVVGHGAWIRRCINMYKGVDNSRSINNCSYVVISM